MGDRLVTPVPVPAVIICALVASVGLAAAGLAAGVRRERETRAMEREEQRRARQEGMEPAVEFPGAAETYGPQDMGAFAPGMYAGSGYTAEPYASEAYGTVFGQRWSDGPGEEVRIAPQDADKLYGTGAARGFQIDLRDLPCTVGKLPEFSDCVLDDPSVSRLHARLMKDRDGIRITDLNSLNGTFLNGRRLDPNESQIIRPGDEIRFGTLEFRYR